MQEVQEEGADAAVDVHDQIRCLLQRVGLHPLRESLTEASAPWYRFRPKRAASTFMLSLSRDSGSAVLVPHSHSNAPVHS